MLMSAPRYGVILFSCVLAACSMGVKDGPPDNTDYDWNKIPDAKPRVEPKSRYGNPSNYEVLGKEYHVMQSAKGFTQKGIASWYGSKFHGQRTSDGEVYDMHKMTASMTADLSSRAGSLICPMRPQLNWALLKRAPRR